MVQPQGPDQPQYPQQGYQPPQYQGGPPGPYSGQPAKKVGVGGCLTSIALAILAVIAFFGIFIWAIAGIITTLKDAPSVPVNETGTVQITNTGTQYLFVGNLDSTSTPVPANDPQVTVTGPDGNVLTVDKPTSSSSASSSGGTEYRLFGTFDANAPGTYKIESSSPTATTGVRIYVTNLDVTNVVTKILVAVAIGFILFAAAVVVAIMWLVRRSRAKKAYAV